MLQIVICMVLNVDSQWYTASGALFAGVVIAQIDIRQHGKCIRVLFLASLILLSICSILSKMTENTVIISKSFTVLAGIGFSCFFFYLQSMLDTFAAKYEKMLLWMIWLGQNSLWLYCIHMKVMELFYAHPSYLVAVYLIASAAFSALAAFLYGVAEKALSHNGSAVQ